MTTFTFISSVISSFLEINPIRCLAVELTGLSCLDNNEAFCKVRLKMINLFETVCLTIL